MTARNTYRVKKKQWRDWSDTARKVFNEVHRHMLNNQHLYLHPKQGALVKPAHWKTTAWNAAFIAACAVDNAMPDYVE